ncbi:CMRF35-like molecule 5 isoform X1 [Salvelinus sp. IW2-2015]|uniref:CMRF35-like molecule 5 isoform X1 n=1 Tax=Salvelinus sp. IW2-2015 TaxID=2691554 RepID=UPI0038D355B9
MRILLIVILLSFMTDDCCEKSVTETAYLGGEATIRCNYPEDHEDRIKYFCKEQDRFICNFMNSNSNKISDPVQRLSVSDNSREIFSTVTIRDLTEDDTGTYWCGVETSRTEQHYITLITQVKLLVRMAPTTIITKSTTTTALPATTTFISKSSSSSASSSPSSSLSPSSSPSSPSSPSSSPLLNGFGTSVVVMVSISLVVLLLLISLIIVYRGNTTRPQDLSLQHTE